MEPVPGTPGSPSSGLGGYTPNNFKLCDKCHDLNIVMGSTSTFPLHAEHMQMAGASCSTCHSSHSSSGPMLVNFDTSIVGGNPTYARTAPGHGTCTLTCHGQTHAASAY
jgi:predicted CXXCH cytochrome family protein